ncbi:hypothetical protein Q7689_32180, partial [Nocardiopsis tropica]|nr:hypothetical protein [Nocardiopsis tropica]
HLTYPEERDRARLPHRSGNEYGIQRDIPYSRAAWTRLWPGAQCLAAPPAGPAIPEWRFGQGTKAWSGAPSDVLAAAAAPQESGHTPVAFVGARTRREVRRASTWSRAGGFLYVYHVEAGRSAREDGAWFTAEPDGYADAPREAGWSAEPGARRCVHVREPGQGGDAGNGGGRGSPRGRCDTGGMGLPDLGVSDGGWAAGVDPWARCPTAPTGRPARRMT